MKNKNINTYKFHSFNSLHEFSSYLEACKPSSIFQGKRLSSEDTSEHTKKFAGTESFDDATLKMKQGDKKNAKLLNKELKVNAPNLGIGTRKRGFNDIIGFVPCTGAYLAGSPLNMINMKNIPAKKKVITIVFDRGIDYTVKTKEIAEVSARLINAIIGIENAGKRVNLFLMTSFASDCSRSPKEAASYLVKVKDSGSLFDKQKFAYPLLNASFLRRQMFKALESEEGLTDEAFTSTHGRVPGKEVIESILKGKRFEYDALFTFYDIRYKNEAGIKDMIEKGK